MSRLTHLVRATKSICAATFLLSMIASGTANATPNVSSEIVGEGQQEQVQVSDDGSLRLAAAATPAPAVYGAFQHFGYVLSPVQRFSSVFDSVRLDYDVRATDGSAVRFDVRASADGVRWTGWEVDLAQGASVPFDTPMRFAQYRATLLSNGASPVVRAATLTPHPTRAIYSAMSVDSAPVAPTFKVHATRMGMVGGRTANGYIIKNRDHFVSLPSWRSLSSKKGGEYMVRLTYKGRSAVVPVMDVGPWNTRDDYWSSRRERFGDLPRGWPEDHAAYYDGYNGGRAEKGHVSFPTAIDVGDGVWWDDLGIQGGRAEVEVTFLWLGRDPGGPAAAQPAPPDPQAATPTPQPTAVPPQPATVVVDDKDAAFKTIAGQDLQGGPAQCGNAATSRWSGSVATLDQSAAAGQWVPNIAAESLYDVYVYVPPCDIGRKATNQAHYLVKHRDGEQIVVVDQQSSAGTWVLLGRFPFRAGSDGAVSLRDWTGEDKHVVWYDAVKWEPAK